MMTADQFFPLFETSLRLTGAEVLESFPHVYPTGALLRLKVRPPWSVDLPPMLDPIGLVYFAQSGRFCGVLQSARVGMDELKLPELVVLDLLRASDLRAPQLPDRRQQAYRLRLEDAIERHRLSPLEV